MGLCCSNPELSFSKFKPIYHNNQCLLIPYHDHKAQRIFKKQVTCSLTFPVHEYSKVSNLGNQEISITGCVLPGMDPSQVYYKECQDNFVCIASPDSIISVLLDGHGKHGKTVAEHCKKHIESYIKSKLHKIQENPTKYVEKIILNCDRNLRSSKIDTNLSGTTAVVVYFGLHSIHVSSVGDSRAIIATCPASAYKNPNKILQAVPLTTDQKPNHASELKRITDCGGLVQRAMSKNGKHLGPYRVWVKGQTLPGLAMSRSIGDKLASSVGVISNPIIQTFPHYANTDKFIVLASDGVWDVMTNDDVAIYLEKFSKLANPKGLKAQFPVTPAKATIARLLCEEARRRWIEIVKKESVLIDDISCVVLEIGEDKDIFIKTLPDRVIESRQSLDDIDGSGTLEGLDFSRNDPNRGTSVNEEDTKE